MMVFKTPPRTTIKLYKVVMVPRPSGLHKMSEIWLGEGGWLALAGPFFQGWVAQPHYHQSNLDASCPCLTHSAKEYHTRERIMVDPKPRPLGSMEV